MAIYKITYAPQFKRAHPYHHGCNFRCKGCSYEVLPKPPYRGEPFLSVDKVKEVLRGLDIERVHFMGGEPTTNPDLPELARFAHEKLGAYTRIGHSNGSIMPTKYIDETSVSIKAYTDSLHIDYTGVSNTDVLKNFVEAHKVGIKLEASSVFIPGFIDSDEIEKIAKFIADVDRGIPYRIIGFVPPPHSPWRKPTHQEVEKAAQIAKGHLSNVTFSCLSTEDFIRVSIHTRYGSIRVA